MLQIKKMIKLTFREDVNLDKENKERGRRNGEKDGTFPRIESFPFYFYWKLHQ